jgi:NAD+ diphosphatase
LFQDIAPHRFHVEYIKRDPSASDLVFISKKNAVLMQEKDGVSSLPDVATVRSAFPLALDALTYLFSVDDTALYLSFYETPETEGYRFSPLFAFRELKPTGLAFAGATAFHLADWYSLNRHCGPVCRADGAQGGRTGAGLSGVP